MDKNFDFIASELFNKIKTQFPRLTLGDKDRKNISNDQVQNARFFEFDYEHKGEKLGHITATLSEKDGLVIIFSNDLIGDKSEYVKKAFFNFLREMREFAKGHLLNFDTRDISKSNLEKRDYEFLSKNQFGDSAMSESKLFGTSKTSYQDLGDARLIVKHSAPVNFEHPAGRAQRIESIYVENIQGERFKYPYRHLNGARALAQHVAHGGTPYDNIGKHVIGLSEELNKLRMFRNYVDRNEAISETMGSISSKVNDRINEVKKEIRSLQSASYYKQFSESFTEVETTEIPEEIVNDWIDRLTIRSFNEELKNVFPYIFKLVGESDIPIKELTADDLVEPTEESVADDFESTIAELDEYEGFLNKIAENKSELFGDNNQDLIDQLNQLLGEEIPLGQDGTNAINSLQGIIEDEELEHVFKEMADIDSSIDARDVIRDYVESKDQEYGTSVASQLNFEGGTAAPAEEPVEVPDEEPSAPAPAPEMPTDPTAAVPPPVQERTVREQLHSMFDELKEFISSMYNANEGNFPKGVEGVKIACEKKFGERVTPIAEKIINRLQTIGEMRRIKELSGVQPVSESVMERMDPEKRARLKDLIGQFSDSVDPSDYASYLDPDEVIDTIRQEFGDRIADQVRAGAEKMHFGRGYGYSGMGDPLSKNMRGKTGDYRTTKKGKMHGQDVLALKSRIKSAAYKPFGRDSKKPNLPEQGVSENNELTAILRIAGLK